MDYDDDVTDPADATRSGGPFNGFAFLVTFFFVWLVFDNFAVGLIIGLFAGGGTGLAQRSINKKRDGEN